MREHAVCSHMPELRLQLLVSFQLVHLGAHHLAQVLVLPSEGCCLHVWRQI